MYTYGTYCFVFEIFNFTIRAKNNNLNILVKMIKKSIYIYKIEINY